jgi:hypothetical protein
MRFTSKLFLLAATAIAAMALSASSAAATSPVEVVVEGGVEHCDVSVGNCDLHVVGESHLTHPNPLVGIISRCQDEFTATFDEDGSGTVTGQSLANKSGSDIPCNSVPCPGSQPYNAWPISGAEETAASTIEATVTFCLGQDAGVQCPADVIITEPSAHQYAFSTVTTCPNLIRVEGNWTAEGDTDVEFQH